MALQDFPTHIINAQHKLYRFALRILGSVQEAEDVVQEVLLKVWEKRKEMPSIQNPEAWCMRMVKNKSLDKLKAKANQPHEEVEKVGLQAKSIHPGNQYEQQDTLAHIRKIIESLPPNQRMCIQLREIEGNSYEEICEIMDINLNQVRTNIYRARQKIKAGLMKLDNFGTVKRQQL